MLSLGHALMKTYSEGSKVQYWVDESIVVGSSRTLEKVEVAFWTIVLPLMALGRGKAVA